MYYCINFMLFKNIINIIKILKITLYKIYKFAIKRVDGLVEYQTGIDLEKYAAAYFL